MKMMCAAIIVLTLTLLPTSIALTHTVAQARGAKGGGHTFGGRYHFMGHHHFARGFHRRGRRGFFRGSDFVQWPLYDGFDIGVPYYESGEPVDYDLPPTVGYAPRPEPALNCDHSLQIVTVPSEEGGTRQVAITRC